jgi:hypothetical protein
MSKKSRGQTAAANSPSAATAPPAPDAPAAAAPAALQTAAKTWFQAYRVEVGLFALGFFVLASFSAQRFLRQSAAPQFIYQAHAWLDGKLDLDPEILPNIEDWACVKERPDGTKFRCEVPPGAPSDRPDPRLFPPVAHWYSSFPWFPAVVMMPFVVVNGYQFNDTSFGVFVGALAIALFYALLRFLSREKESERSQAENIVLAVVLGFGTLFFYCAIRGEVWFSAEIMGVALTCLYLRNAVGARNPLLAGAFFSMATLTRTPLFFSGLFFVLEALCPGPTHRLEQLKKLADDWKPAARKLGLFAAGAAPLGVFAALYNKYRFGAFGEFGHKFLYFNRVSADIDRYGLFDTHYMSRNLEAAFLKFPELHFNPLRLNYDPIGMSMLLTLPLLVFLLIPKQKPRLHWPLWLTVAITALPGLAYQWTGYMQFGYRFSLDYTPYLLLLFAVGGWQLKSRWVTGALAVGLLINFWGAVAFHGYTELVRGW